MNENYEGYARTEFDKDRMSQFKNVITRALLSLEPEHWIVPYLHCMLGEIHKFWTMTKQELLQLELKLARLIAPDSGFLGSTKYEQYIKHLREILIMEGKVNGIQRKIEKITEDIEHGLISSQKGLKNASMELESLQIRKEKLETDINSMYSQHTLEMGEGPFTSKLEAILDQHKIKQEHYYGGIFNGNACRKFLHVYEGVYDAIYSTVKLVAESTGHMDILYDASTLVVRYKRLFQLRLKVHKLVAHSKPIHDNELPDSQSAIDDYLNHYRVMLGGKIIVKMHLLEDHAVEHLRKFKMGFGLLGEHGFESIHHKFKETWNHNISKPPTKRLWCSMERHHVNVVPYLQSLKPQVKRRKVDRSKSDKCSS